MRLLKSASDHVSFIHGTKISVHASSTELARDSIVIAEYYIGGYASELRVAQVKLFTIWRKIRYQRRSNKVNRLLHTLFIECVS